MTSRPEFGVLYASDGNPAFRRMLEISRESLRRFHPGWPVEVVTLRDPHVSWLRGAYRQLTFWKAAARLARAGQDVRSIAQKPAVMLGSPFRHTLYLDVDTVVLRPLDGLRARALDADVLVTPLPWKRYARQEPWQPESWPYVMAGVAFFSERFREAYRPWVERAGPRIEALPTQDQFVFSLACDQERERLRVELEPRLQVDVLNLAHHLGEEPGGDDAPPIALDDPRLDPFHVFHYNHHKLHYLKEAARHLGLE